MSEPMLGEIRLFPMKFAPEDWALCNGQHLSVNLYQALFSLLGTTYGGEGTTTFALPDLRERVPVHPNDAIPLGRAGGENAHALTIPEMPIHTHVVRGSSSTAFTGTITNNFWANAPSMFSKTADLLMNPAAIAHSGESQHHDNMQPYLVLNYCIALVGIYPSRP
jgi:microcystin-dependent protein